MKTQLTRYLLAALIGVAFTAHLHAQTSAFTYQGQLTENGSPANGFYDIHFWLAEFDAGLYAIVAGPLSNNAVSVSNGLFTLPVDFDYSAFPGDDRYLYMEVRTNGTGAFTGLLPPQQITSAPYAVYAARADTVVSGAVVNPSFIGTTSLDPLVLSISKTPAFRIQYAASPGGMQPNLVAGYYENRIDEFVRGSVIGGGGADGASNSISGDLNTRGNVIGGGVNNHILNCSDAVIAGGANNRVSTNADYSVIAGGRNNEIVADAYGAFAAGTRAKVNHPGGFIWADSQNADFATSGNDQFLVRAAGGVGVNTASPRADLHVNGPMVIEANGVTPTSTSSSNLLNLMVGGGSNPAATNGARNGISFYEGAGSVAMSLGYDGSGSAGANAVRIYDGVAAESRVSFQQNGRVGMGTAAPKTELHVARGSAGAVNPSDQALLTLESETNSFVHLLTPEANYSGVLFGSPVGAFDASIRYNFFGGRELIFRSGGNSTRMVILTNGNVGIGTTTPTNKLHVIGGVSATAFVTTSDRNAKENFRPVDPLSVLEKVAALPLSRWSFKEQSDGEHLGPMAQDFKAAFGLGNTDTGIATVDADGVALAAIQGLNQKVEGRMQNAEVRTQKLEQLLGQKGTEITELRQTVNELKQLVQAMSWQLKGEEQ